VLRFDFPGYRGKDKLEPISWDEFFKKFDEKKLVFLYQDRTAEALLQIRERRGPGPARS
jgi:anaerobic selenocysteine-containing dehydrogenase